MLRLLFLLFLLSVFVARCRILLEEMPEEEGTQEEDREGHIAVIRPDYSIWKMVKVLKNMFESRTEKRRQRDYVVDEPHVSHHLPLRARRLLFNL